MEIYITEHGYQYEGASFLEAFTSFKDALKSKPSCFFFKRKNSNLHKAIYDLHKDRDYDNEYFIITKINLLHNSELKKYKCAVCLKSHFVIYKDICSTCAGGIKTFKNDSLQWFKRDEVRMNEALE